ncbi:MAG: 6-bladed beta-propeller [Chloroflexi bacterium]|nr:6-bladed beta-propeller [Chloroflexota bacterium]
MPIIHQVVVRRRTVLQLMAGGVLATAVGCAAPAAPTGEPTKPAAPSAPAQSTGLPAPTPLPFVEVDPVKVQFVRSIGTSGAGDGQFAEPRHIAVDKQGNLYVADRELGRVQVFNKDGAFQRAWGKRGKSENDGEFADLRSLRLDSAGNLLTLDGEHGWLKKFTPAGNFVFKFGPDKTESYHPAGLGLDGSDNVYLADTGNNRILKFDRSGSLVGTFGQPGKGDGQLDQPTDVVVDGQGGIYVADTGNDRIQKFDASFKALHKWAMPHANTVEGPHLALAAAGTLYVTDPEGGRVLAFDANGKLLGRIGSRGDGQDQFQRPLGITVDANSIYVVDRGKRQVLQFSVG